MDYLRERNIVTARIEELETRQLEITREINRQRKRYADLIIQEHEPVWRELWRALCVQEGWGDSESPFFWNDEHGCFCAGGRTMHDTEYDINKAVNKVYESCNRRLKVQNG